MAREPKFNTDPNWPKAKYHEVHGGAVVNSAEEEEALGEGWYDSPADFGVITAPSQAQLRKQELKRFQEQDEAAEDAATDPANTELGFGKKTPGRRR